MMTLYGVIVTHNSFASEADIVIGDVYLLFWPWGSYKLCWKKSNYQIHLNLIIFQTLGWYLYIIRAICWYSKQPVFLNNLLKKVSLFLNSLHASPTRWVIKILLLCWKSIMLFIEIVLLFQPCFHCCTNFNFHHPTTSCINGLDFVSVVFR